MWGVRVTKISGKSLDMCSSCEQLANSAISVAMFLHLIFKPIVVRIKHCELCEESDEELNSEA